jgi:hypothetical protein
MSINNTWFLGILNFSFKTQDAIRGGLSQQMINITDYGNERAGTEIRTYRLLD